MDLTACQRVAPRDRAACLIELGTVLRASRVAMIMMGRINSASVRLLLKLIYQGKAA